LSSVASAKEEARKINGLTPRSAATEVVHNAKSSGLLSLAVLSLLTAYHSALGNPEVSKGEKAIAVVSIGQFDTNLFDRVTRFVGDNYYCSIRAKPNQNTIQKSPEEGAQDLEKLIGPDDICLLGLVNIHQDVKFFEAVFQSRKVALLNIRALRPDNMKNDTAMEKYARRVEKESMRLIGQLIGLNPCPFPRCALYIAASEQELDAKSRNLCPPCQGKAAELLRAKGVRLTVDY